MKEVWALVLNWHGEADTRRCLASLAAQDYPALHTLVIDNGSDPAETARLAADLLPEQCLALGENFGYAGGMNRGAAYALARGAAYVLLLNNDTTLAPDAVGQLVAALANGDLAAPTIHRADGSGPWYSGGTLSTWTAAARHDTRSPAPSQGSRPVTFASGCCLLISAEAFATLGGLDERYFLYYEDVDLCERAREAGLRLLHVPAAQIWHSVGASLGGDRHKAPVVDYYDVRNGLLFLKGRRVPLVRQLSGWTHFFCVRLPRKIIRVFWRSNQRCAAGKEAPWASIRAIAQGLAHGLSGREGPRPLAASPANARVGNDPVG